MYKLKGVYKEYLVTQPMYVLREVGRVVGVKSPTSKTKEQLINDIIAIQDHKLLPIPQSNRGAPPKFKVDISQFVEEIPDKEKKEPLAPGDFDYTTIPYDEEKNSYIFADSAFSCSTVEGILEQHQNGFGFIRTNSFGNSKDDAYISRLDILQFNLRSGDKVKANVKVVKEGDSAAVQEVLAVNDLPPRSFIIRSDFEKLVPFYPNERITLSGESNKDDYAMRIIDLFAPIGKGQRGLIVAPPKTGKTTLITNIAKAIENNNKKIRLFLLLIDERPEEVTDIKRNIKSDVIYSTFDDSSEHHIRAAEHVLNRAKRLVEGGLDVVILMDSITRLVRAYNNTIESSGKTLSGGLDPLAMSTPKKIFGSARNIEKGGSLTIISTALVETGSRMDDVIYEEFKGTGNMEICLSRELAEKRIFPAIDIKKSGTRREELLLSENELSLVYKLRRLLASKSDDTEMLIDILKKTKDNNDLAEKIDSYLKVYDKK